MPVEFLQFGGFLAMIAVIALLWYAFVYRARRTGEGDGTPRQKRSRRRPSDEDVDEGEK